MTVIGDKTAENNSNSFGMGIVKEICIGSFVVVVIVVLTVFFFV